MVNSKKEIEKKDWFSVIMIVQTVVCAIIITLLVVSAYSDGKFASLMRDEYTKLMTGDITVDDIADALKNLNSDDKPAASAESQSLSDVTSDNIHDDPVSEVYDEIESESVIGGGEDLQFTSLDTLEGICFDEYNVDFSMIVPLDNYRVTSRFGYRISPVSDSAGLHTGIDLAADYGTPIYASADGYVLDAMYDNSYGNYVKIQHPDGFVTIYAHCSLLNVKSGETVKQGDVIAKVGSTGASTGNHLHFEMRKDNIRVNPEYVLTDL